MLRGSRVFVEGISRSKDLECYLHRKLCTAVQLASPYLDALPSVGEFQVFLEFS